MPRGRTQEGYSCKYAPYYRGHYKSKYIPDTLEEKQRLTRRMAKQTEQIIMNLIYLEEKAEPKDKHYFNGLRRKFKERSKFFNAETLDRIRQETETEILLRRS